MDRPAVRARTPTSAAGSRPAPAPRPRGFTLVELLVVLALLGLLVATVSLSLRDPAASRLDLESARLIAVLEAARAESRAHATPVRWVAVPSLAQPTTGNDIEAQGFRLLGLPAQTDLPGNRAAAPWLDNSMPMRVRVFPGPSLLLGPEPVIPAQTVTLSLGNRSAVLVTNGLRPFAPAPTAADATRAN